MSLTEDLKNKLMPLYSELLKHKTKNGYTTFCAQWGKEFPTSSNKGLMFVGKATNGWGAEWDLERIFDDTKEDCIFNNPNQMEWMADSQGNAQYNDNKSSFLRVLREATCELYQSDEWYKYISWSNLCKLAPSTGNPNLATRKLHLDVNKKILHAEIELLSPKVVVFLTGMTWVKSFFNEFKDEAFKPVKTIHWFKYTASLYNMGSYYIIISEHPQGKKEDPHIKALKNLIGVAYDSV